MLTDGANFRNECYHTPSDTLDNKLHFTFMSNVVKATLAAMAELVEIQHGDWAAAGFELTSAANEPAPCGFKLLQNDGLALQAGTCFAEKISVEFYDMNGARLSQQTLQIPEGGYIALKTTDLPAGVYALKIQHGNGIFSQKVMIR